MKTCPECGKSFKNLGAHMKAHRSENVQERVQETCEETGEKRPVRRFSRLVFSDNGAMFRR